VNRDQLRDRLGEALVEGQASAPARQVLDASAVGYLAMAGGGWPYVVPISFAANGDTVFFHGGGSLKASLLEAEPRVCLAVTTRPEFMPADDPCDENFRYESVLAFGEVELVEDDAERDRALRLIVEKYDAALAHAPFKGSVLQGTSVWALRVDALTYKRNPPAS
jgi:nitroimidazol reductase NimA-like FMN-containing flavoprotein (pyridoxamine 5'-phosphate oxidase superfamily)